MFSWHHFLDCFTFLIPIAPSWSGKSKSAHWHFRDSTGNDKNDWGILKMCRVQAYAFVTSVTDFFYLSHRSYCTSKKNHCDNAHPQPYPTSKQSHHSLCAVSILWLFHHCQCVSRLQLTSPQFRVLIIARYECRLELWLCQVKSTWSNHIICQTSNGVSPSWLLTSFVSCFHAWAPPLFPAASQHPLWFFDPPSTPFSPARYLGVWVKSPFSLAAPCIFILANGLIS